MSRLKVILIATVPALFLLVSADCFGDPTIRYGCNGSQCVFSAHASGKHQLPLSDNSVDQVVPHGGRRVNVEPRADGFAPPVAPTQYQTLRHGERGRFRDLTGISLELSQSWQFLWRTALEPRPPSSAS
jgi:hypothetical protein